MADVFFRQHGVHFVAIAINVDSYDQNSNGFAPFLNNMNKWYLRDLSRKQRTAIRVKGESGKPATNCAIYGYKKDPENKCHWLIHEEAEIRSIREWLHQKQRQAQRRQNKKKSRDRWER